MLDFYPIIASNYARRCRAKYTVLLHDRPEIWTSSDDEYCLKKAKFTKLCYDADMVLAVTQQLLDWYAVPTQVGKVLLPIPGKGLYHPRWTAKRRSRFRIVHSGSLNAHQMHALSIFARQLDEAGGTLVLISPPWDTIADELASTHRNVERLPFFEQNEQAVQYVAANALAFLIAYSFDPGPRAMSGESFPSKLLEFIRAGVPSIILAPPTAAITGWAVAQNWPMLCNSLGSVELSTLIGRIQDKAAWEAAQHHGLALAGGACDADGIHSDFLKSLATEGRGRK
jgi:hypothetical protein